MPSPVGHGLGAIAVGMLVASAAPTPRDRWIQIGLFAAIGAAPDLDLLIGRHNAETHSIGAAAIVATVAAVMRWPIARSRPRIWLAACAAWFSHPILDVFGADTSLPLGVMLWWPFSSAHIFAGVPVFMAISRRWHLPGTLSHNLIAALRELLILGPLAALALIVGTEKKKTQN